MKWYWYRFHALPVTVHLARDHRFEWQAILGLQVGPWFFGAIRGSASQGAAAVRTTQNDGDLSRVVKWGSS